MKCLFLFVFTIPYLQAHRATLALEHHKGRVEYEWVEALVGKIVQIPFVPSTC